MRDELAFNSRIDLWLLILVLTAVSLCVWIIADNWEAMLARGWLFTTLIAAPLSAGILLPLWLLISLRYFLSDEMLRVRCGPFHWRIAIRDITAVSETREPLSSPAMSFDRLRIEYGDGRAVAISPEPRAEFLRQLEHRRSQAAG